MCCDWTPNPKKMKKTELMVDFSEVRDLIERLPEVLAGLSKPTYKIVKAKEQSIYMIGFPHFVSILAHGLSDKEIKQIKKIKSTMSSDEYGGYSPQEHEKYRRIVDIVGERIIQPIGI